jgi:hypothetical protein
MSASEPAEGRQGQPLYTSAERARRDATKWTLVQGILAPIQFLAFAISLCLVVNYLLNGAGLAAATLSVVVKTFLLYAIMITGAIWEKVVFGSLSFCAGFFLGRRSQHGGHVPAYGLCRDVVGRMGNPGRANVGGISGLRELRRERLAVPIEVSGREKDEC